MSEELLATKLTPPAPRRQVVARPRLLALLDGGLERRLTLVSASAGAGKTTLLSHWADQQTLPLAWLTLDVEDNDPWRFLAYLGAALRGLHPQMREPEGLSLHAAQAFGVEARLVHLMNQLVDLAKDAALVLDDYHLINAPSVHQAVGRLVASAPARLHLYLSSRADPPLPLARLRAQGELVEVRVADLRFRPDEAEAFLSQVMGLSLSSAEVGALAARTEGWAAGLQLAGLSLQRAHDRASFVANFAGSHSYVADYLLEEVLSAQPEPVVCFMLQTSILPRLTAPLCEAVTGERGAHEMLERLYAENLFLTALDAERRWFAYHQLFADLLRHRLERELPGRQSALHARAAGWHLENGSTARAIPHLLEAGLAEEAADAIEQAAGALLERSEAATLAGWLERLPEELVLRRPALGLWRVWTQMLGAYSLQGTEPYYDAVARDDPARLLALNAYVALFQGRLAEAQQLAQRALGSPLVTDAFQRNVAHWVQTMARVTEVDLYTGGRAVLELANEEQAKGNRLGAALTLNSLAELYMRQGKLRQAEATMERVLELGVDEAGQPLPVSGMALVGLAEIARERNDLATAKRRLMQGMERLKGWGETASIDAYGVLSAILLIEGDAQGAIDAANRAHLLARASDATDLDDQITELMQARLRIRLGDLDAARAWLQENAGGPQGIRERLDGELGYLDYHILHHTALTLVRLQMAERRHASALDLLDRLQVGIERYGWRPSRREMEVQALRALALAGMGQGAAALLALERTLVQAQPEGYVRTFLDEGPAMARLLQKAVQQGVQADYARELLRAFPEVPQPEALVEPLSEREQEVLALIAQGLTNPQIAERLIVALGTVKAHTANIYGKLGVRSRLQAAARARELGLL